MKVDFYFKDDFPDFRNVLIFQNTQQLTYLSSIIIDKDNQASFSKTHA